MTRRIGLLGFGGIGRNLYERIASEPALGLEVAFVHARNPARVADLPASLVLRDPAAMAAYRADLIVEAAHPDYTRRWGETIVAAADYLPLSMSAFCDDALFARLTGAAERAGHRLFIPHGALVGTDNLYEWRHMWREVTIKFIKNPANIDFSESGFDASRIRGETIVYDGPVRGIAPLYPRNVNTMVTCALATVGLDRCRAILAAVPGLEVGVIEIAAIGHDGATLTLRKSQPMSSVSGTEMFASLLASVRRAAGAFGTVEFV